MIVTEIISRPLSSFPSDDSRTNEGAELVFNGRVREKEDGKKIIALEYEHYDGMADSELQSLAEITVKKFKINDLFCYHRIGSVPVGQTSLQVSIWSKHRKESIEAMDYFIKELKKNVPNWKWAILLSGRKVPSKCNHD